MQMGRFRKCGLKGGALLGVHLHGNLKGKVSENVVFGMGWSLRWGLFA